MKWSGDGYGLFNVQVSFIVDSFCWIVMKNEIVSNRFYMGSGADPAPNDQARSFFRARIVRRKMEKSRMREGIGSFRTGRIVEVFKWCIAIFCRSIRSEDDSFRERYDEVEQ